MPLDHDPRNVPKNPIVTNLLVARSSFLFTFSQTSWGYRDDPLPFLKTAMFLRAIFKRAGLQIHSWLTSSKSWGMTQLDSSGVQSESGDAQHNIIVSSLASHTLFPSDWGCGLRDQRTRISWPSSKCVRILRGAAEEAARVFLVKGGSGMQVWF